MERFKSNIHKAYDKWLTYNLQLSITQSSNLTPEKDIESLCDAFTVTKNNEKMIVSWFLYRVFKKTRTLRFLCENFSNNILKKSPIKDILKKFSPKNAKVRVFFWLTLCFIYHLFRPKNLDVEFSINILLLTVLVLPLLIIWVLML